MGKNKDPGSIEKKIHILAPVDAVWKALTDAEELKRWFPLDAKVRPGEGGHIWMAWKNDKQHHAPIAAWEPNKNLRLILPEPTPTARPGEPAAPSALPNQSTLDYILESRGDETVLHLVHSGLSPEPPGSSYYQGTGNGWDFHLAGLKLYLERHYGSPRLCVYCRAPIPHWSLHEAWQKLMSPAGFLKDAHPAPSRADARYALTTSLGDRFEGLVHAWTPPTNFVATITNLNDAWMRLHLDDLPRFDRRDVNFIIATYALPERQVNELQDRFDRLFGTLFRVP